MNPGTSLVELLQEINCLMDVARSFQEQSDNSMLQVAPTDPSGGEVAKLNARIAELEAENATLSGQKSVSAIVAGDNVAELKSQLYTALNDLADADVSAFCTIDTHFLAKIKPEIFRSLCYRKKDGMWWKLYASDGVSCSEHKKNGTYRHSNCG